MLDSSKLAESFRDKIERRPDEVYVPSVCTWEAMLLAQTGRISFGEGRPEQHLQEYLQASRFNEAPLTSRIAALSRTLEFEHEDPADRFIAATAHAMNAQLATSDRRLRNLSWIRLAY
jgi:PIN domain nuclease of toxin-antitoxin system